MAPVTVTRFTKLPKHDNIIVGRDLDKIFENGKVYGIRKFGDEYVITCLGDSAIAADGTWPNHNSKVSEIMTTGRYLWTTEELEKFEKDDE